MGLIGMISLGTVGTATALIDGANMIAGLVDSRPHEAQEDEEYLWDTSFEDADTARVEGDLALVISAGRRLIDVPADFVTPAYP